MPVDPNQTLKELEESLKSIKEGSQDIVDTFNISLVNSLQRSIIEVDKLTNGFKKGDDITKDIKKSFTDITRTQISLSNKSIDLEKQLKKALKENKVIRQDEIIDELTSIKLQQKLNEDILVQLNTLKNLNSQQDTFSNALKKTVETQISSVKEMLTLTGLMGLIVKGALNYNKYSVETGKALGYSAEKSNEIQTNFNKLAFTTENVNVNSISLNEAFSQLAQSTGYVSEYSDDALITQIKLTKQVGLTGDEAAQFQRFSVLTGQSSEKVYQSFVKGLVAQRNQSRVGINFKATLAEAAKVSGQLAANLGYNPERIARAVVQAKAFGMTLEQTAKTSESLLNFESSIENELKAELLTGKQLNLERARAAALSGDQATVAAEIAANVGTAADFAKMNVLQQKSLAEAVGMTADELGETLRRREEALASGKSLAQVTEEEATKALERQNIQEKFNAAIEKLQSLIGGIVAGPLGTMLDYLIQSVDYINAAVVGLGAIYAWTRSIAAVQAIQTALKTREVTATAATNILLAAKNTLLNTQLGKQIAIAAAWTIANPIQAVIGLGLAAGVGALIYSQMSDGIIGPGGETIVSGPKGSIQLDKGDSLIAGTNLFDKGMTNNGQTISQVIDLTPMITAINQVKASIDRLYSKDTSINMDGKKVGTTLTQGSYKLA
jgi:hypothetical protein